jgi:hypothetical protein
MSEEKFTECEEMRFSEMLNFAAVTATASFSSLTLMKPANRA